MATRSMISIVISEKGGAERRERYEQNEITIGRVKGNLYSPDY